MIITVRKCTITTSTTEGWTHSEEECYADHWPCTPLESKGANLNLSPVYSPNILGSDAHDYQLDIRAHPIYSPSTLCKGAVVYYCLLSPTYFTTVTTLAFTVSLL